MDYRRGCLGTFLVGLGLVLCLTPQQEKPRAQSEKPSGEARPLIRKDLLNFSEEPLPASLRDIFKPKLTGTTIPVRRIPAAPKPAPKAPPPGEEAPLFTLALSYVGSVQAGGRTMALVLRSGEAVPVAEGEEIIPGYRVIRISPLEIEVEGPGGVRRVFSRQGDR